MPAGAVHPNSGNFSRAARLNIVERVRKLVAQNAYEKRPEWMEFVERAPPIELDNLKLRDVKLKSPYPHMVQYVLRQFPDMRFQDAFVDGNDWSKGNDRYRDDHPVMQFVARQLQLMNTSGMSRQAALMQTKEEYMQRRLELERMQKLEMALAQNQRIVPAFGSAQYVPPLFTTGAAIAHYREAQLEVSHLNHIRRKLRMLRKEIEPHDKRRMNAKEMALDMEVERTSLLPRMPPSPYKVAEQPVVDKTGSDKAHIPEDLDEEEYDEDGAFIDERSSMDQRRWMNERSMESTGFEFEFMPSHEEDERSAPLEVFESSTVTEGHKKPRPVDVREADQSRWAADLIPTDDERKYVKSVPSDRPPVMPQVKASKPAFTFSRPDKQTVQAILAKKKNEELQKRLGKEPGETDGDNLDFEDFINMINKQKS